MRDSDAAKRLLFRRLKALHTYETANRVLEKARAKNKDVHAVSIAELIFLTYNIEIFKREGETKKDLKPLNK